MMTRFYRYIDKVFEFRRLIGNLTDSRVEPVIPTAAVFGTAFAMFATCRGSLNGIDVDRRCPGRLQKFVGPHVPSGDTVGRVYTQLDSGTLRAVLREVHLHIKRNKMLGNTTESLFAAVDGHEFFRQPQTLLRPVPHPHIESG
jgi:hypothetical protein